MSMAIDILRHEHDAVLMALKILDSMTDAANSGMTSAADFDDFLNFLQEFVDKCHHGKEEGLLFPAMIAAGLPDRNSPIAVMLAEHEEGRSFVAAMRRAITPSLEMSAFVKAAHAYAAHLRAHIDKENHVMFPMAEQILSSDVLAQLAQAFEQHEENVIGHGRHEELHEMLKGLKVKYRA